MFLVPEDVLLVLFGGQNCFGQYAIKGSQIYVHRTSMMERFYENSQLLKGVNYFCKNASSWICSWVLNTPEGVHVKVYADFANSGSLPSLHFPVQS